MEETRSDAASRRGALGAKKEGLQGGRDQSGYIRARIATRRSQRIEGPLARALESESRARLADGRRPEAVYATPAILISWHYDQGVGNCCVNVPSDFQTLASPKYQARACAAIKIEGSHNVQLD
jgi:hypothetical protein